MTPDPLTVRPMQVRWQHQDGSALKLSGYPPLLQHDEYKPLYPLTLGRVHSAPVFDFKKFGNGIAALQGGILFQLLRPLPITTPKEDLCMLGSRGQYQPVSLFGGTFRLPESRSGVASRFMALGSAVFFDPDGSGTMQADGLQPDQLSRSPAKLPSMVLGF